MIRGRSVALALAVLSTASLAAGADQGEAENVAEIPYHSVPNFLKLPPNLYLGEGIGVATNSKGHVFVYTRSGDTRLFEFDQNGVFVREIGQGLYGFEFAHAVRVDRDDNVWAVDEGTNMVIKFDPQGRVAMVMGRRPDAVDGIVTPAAGSAPPAPEPYVFSRPTDIGWDPSGNIFVTDGYGNSRVVKFDKNGRFVKEAGTKGDERGQLNLPHTMAVDAQGNVYVGDRNNARVQVFDNDLNVKAIYDNVGSPWAVCISPGPHQYLFVSNSIPDNGLAQSRRHHRRDLQDGARRHDRRAIRQGRASSSASSARCTRSTAAIPTSCWSRKSPRGVSRRSSSGPQPTAVGGGIAAVRGAARRLMFGRRPVLALRRPARGRPLFQRSSSTLPQTF